MCITVEVTVNELQMGNFKRTICNKWQKKKQPGSVMIIDFNTNIQHIV